MTYRTSHLGVDIEFRLNVKGGEVDLNIEPAFAQSVFQQAKIGNVYLEGKQMTTFEPHEKADLDALEKLRQTLNLDTVIPHTIYTFAEVRVRRYESELEKCRAALKLAKDSLEEIAIDASQFDFGPAYAGAVQRQNDAVKAINKALKETK